MPRFISDNQANFVKGLLTEVSELTFPAQYASDMSNCSLSRDGKLSRRLGLQKELGTTESVETYVQGALTRTLTWENVGGESGVEFSVVQIGGKLRFYDKSSEQLSDGEVFTDNIGSATVYELDLTTYNRPTGLGAGQAPIQVASIKGGLVVVSPEINSILIERSSVDGSFTVTEIEFEERDFEYLGDTSTYASSQSLTPTDLNREYDTKNSGWGGSTAYTTYTAGTGNYPPLNIVWHSAKDASDNFDLTLFNKLADEGSTSLIGNGRYILNMYTGDRETVSGITGVTNSPENTRFSTVAAFAGRVFFAGLSSPLRTSRIYFTQTLNDLSIIGKLHSQNDPTAEFLSDGLDTDGGFIDIPEAHDIKVIYEWKNALLVFADNGVWQIDGVDQVFRATEFRVRKVFDTGIYRATSFATLDGTPFWWSVDGIFTITQSQLGDPSPQDISRATIQTFWDNIEVSAKDTVFSQVDEVNKRIFWFYANNDETIEYKYNNALILDATLEAFYPWTISDQAENTSYIIGSSFYRNANRGASTFDVVDSSGDQVQDSSFNDVQAELIGTIAGTGTRIKMLIINNNGTIQWAEFRGIDFLDWEDTNYTSYAVTGDNPMGDLTLRKSAPYVTVYMNVTETGWEASGGGYVPIREGSLKVSSFWDSKSSSAVTSQQAYRLKLIPAVDTSDLTTFGYPHETIQTRLKLRGRGRFLKIRYESEQGKDFQLLGWGLVGALNDRF